jgi:tetratricopeptide (TPR) repeat protein
MAALSAAKRLKDRDSYGAHLSNLGQAYSDLGDVQSAIELYKKSLAISRETGDRQMQAYDFNNLGQAYADLGEVQRAIKFYKRALKIDKESGNRRGEAMISDIWEQPILCWVKLEIPWTTSRKS